MSEFHTPLRNNRMPCTVSLRWAVALYGVLHFALFLAMPTAATPAAATPHRGGTLTVAADTEPRNLNPAIAASNGVFYVASKIVEPLAEMGYDGLQPVLATHWWSSADGRRFTVRLRDGVRWSDGEPLSSADLAFSAMQVWKPLQNIGRGVFANLERVDTPDDLTAVFHFSRPTPQQLLENALPAVSAVVPEHVLADEDIATSDYNRAPLGTGPFMFDEHRPGEYYRLIRNPDYWDSGKPYLDRIVYRVLPDAGARAAALETGAIQLAAFSAVPLTDMQRLDALEGLSVIGDGYEGITYAITVEINHRRAELADPRVRRAIAMAIDKQFIVDVIFLGYAEAATGPIPTTARDFYTDDVVQYAFDPKAAETLLDEAGYPRGDDGRRFSLRLRPAPWFEQTRAVGSYVAQALKAIGIGVEIVSADPGGHIAAVYTEHDFDLAIGSPVYRNDPAISTTILYQGGLEPGVPFSNQYGYSHDGIDGLIARGIATLDAEERVDVYADLQRLVAEDVPLLHLVHFSFLTVASDRLRNVANNPRWATSSWADTWLEK